VVSGRGGVRASERALRESKTLQRAPASKAKSRVNALGQNYHLPCSRRRHKQLCNAEYSRPPLCNTCMYFPRHHPSAAVFYGIGDCLRKYGILYSSSVN
jgi:hypothetical protein